MRFIETDVFTEEVTETLSDEEYRALVRVIYYWDESHDTIYLLLIYRKVDQDDLTPAQLKTLRRLVREELK